MSELALKLIRECKETRATRLDLGNCGLTELPDELFELTWLEELILSNTWFEYSEIDYNPIKRISENVYEKKGKPNFLNNLKPKQNIFDRILNKRQASFSDLSNLKKIILCGGNKHFWEIRDLSPLSELLNLEYIDFSFTQVQNITPLENLTRLKTINARGSLVKTINLNSLKKLYNLEVLDLVSLRISSIESLQKLVNLKLLDISGTFIYDLVPLQGITNLKKLYAYYSQISDLTPLQDIISLEDIHLGDTKVSDLNPLQKMLHLKYVNIIDTKIKSIHPLIGIIKKGIEVKSGNMIEYNSKKYNDDGIYIDGYLDNPPNEIIREGNEAILNYWNQKEKQGTVELYEAKLIIVGEGATGKTTLFEKLKDKNHQIGNTSETHGINIHEGLPFKHTHIGDNTFHANLWDFGGQELQYMTHQFFLTPRALYVLMMDARRESPNLAYWFKIISLLGRDNADSTEKVRLLLVFNKRGNSTGTPPQYQDQLKYYEDSLDVQYLEVDFAENDYRFDNLQNAIQQSLVTLPIVKSQLPRLWKAVREDLREEAKTENYIDTKRFSAICSKHGITEEADQWLLSGYLHQLGSLLHFQNDKGLRRLVILSPQWAVDGVYTFLSEESIARNNGRFTETEFMALLARRAYNRDDADVILQLMTKNNFDICYEATEGHYVAAQLLPDNRPPQYFWEKKFGALQFRYQYPIMPKGLMSRLIVRLSEYIEKRNNEGVVWKKGAILSISTDKNNPESYCRVLMYEDNAESQSGIRQIIFEVMGDPQTHRKHALHRVREEVESLHKKWFRSIKADEMVPCCCSECTISDNPQLYKLENLLKRRLKRPDTSCDVSGEDLMIQQLLEGVYDKGEIRDMENQGKY